MFTRLFTSMKVQVTFIASVTAALVLFNVSPEKQAQAITFVATVFGLATAVIVATGYEDGQEKSAGAADDQTKPPTIPPAATAMILLLILPFALGGCANPNLPLITGGAKFATLEIIGHQPPAKQKPIAQATLNIATAVAQATQTAPDLTTIKSFTRPAIAREVAKLNPADAITVQFLLDASLDAADAAYLQAINTATATDKGKMAQSIEQAALTGIQMGARQVLNTPVSPPATQPN